MRKRSEDRRNIHKRSGSANPQRHKGGQGRTRDCIVKRHRTITTGSQRDSGPNSIGTREIEHECHVILCWWNPTRVHVRRRRSRRERFVVHPREQDGLHPWRPSATRRRPCFKYLFLRHCPFAPAPRRPPQSNQSMPVSRGARKLPPRGRRWCKRQRTHASGRCVYPPAQSQIAVARPIE